MNPKTKKTSERISLKEYLKKRQELIGRRKRCRRNASFEFWVEQAQYNKRARELGHNVITRTFNLSVLQREYEEKLAECDHAFLTSLKSLQKDTPLAKLIFIEEY